MPRSGTPNTFGPARSGRPPKLPPIGRRTTPAEWIERKLTLPRFFLAAAGFVVLVIGGRLAAGGELDEVVPGLAPRRPGPTLPRF